LFRSKESLHDNKKEGAITIQERKTVNTREVHERRDGKTNVAEREKEGR